MSKKEFNPYEYKKRKQIEVAIPGRTGIYQVMNWSARKKKYVPVLRGKRYSAKKLFLGKQMTKRFSSQSEAQSWRVEGEGAVTLQALSFRKVKEQYLAKKKADVRVVTYESSVSKCKHLKFFDDLNILDITPKTIDLWIQYIKSPSYLMGQHSHRVMYKHELSELRQVLNYYSEYICEDVAYSLPIKKRHKKDIIVDKQKYLELKSKSKRNFLNGREIRSFLNAFDSRVERKPQDEPFALLAKFQMGTGTRIGEAAAIHWQDISFDKEQIYINRTVEFSRHKGRKTKVVNTTKTGVCRYLPLSSDVVNLLKLWSLKSGKGKGLVFWTEPDHPLEYRSIVHRYDCVLKSIGSEWRGTHLARHSFATDFLEKTGNHRALQGLLGHESSRQTDHYAKMTGVTLMDGMKQYEEAKLKFIGQS